MIMQPICGKPVLQYVTEACQETGISDITIIVPNESEDIRKALPGLNYVTQHKSHTGHAVEPAAGHIKPDDDVLIIAGNMPLVTPDFIREFITYYTSNKHNSPIAPPNLPGIYLSKGSILFARKATHNFKPETDTTPFICISTHAQLADATRQMQNRINLRHMENGVRIQDPATTYIDSTVQIAPGAIIYPGSIIEGTCTIAEGAIIGPYTHMRDSTVGQLSAIRHSVLTSAEVGTQTEVGPFAYLRPGAKIGNKCRVGNFVEIKNATLANGAKAAHLAYIGDADIGQRVNIGCGVITANYDGKNKHRTTVEDGAFIGSNANLVAPVTIGENAFVAAGSTITKELPAHSLGIARARQENKENWVKR